jgi:hypothetical protein
MHSSSPYEFFVGGNYQINQFHSGSSFNGWEGFIGAYSTIIGLEARYESLFAQRFYGIFNLRVVGFHDQATNLTFQAGIRNTSQGDDSFRNAMAGLSLTFYLNRSFGLEALYRHYFDSTPDSFGLVHSGDRYQGGIFIDFAFLRIDGIYMSDLENSQFYSGAWIGTKVYF